jgi:hypothetical protein
MPADRFSDPTLPLLLLTPLALELEPLASCQPAGHVSLDREALALIERAQPLPPLPDEVPSSVIELVLPLRFQLH